MPPAGVRVDYAEGAEDDCRRDNAVAAQHLGEACEARGIAGLHISSDLVFAGRARPYVEADTPDPLNAYGRSKAQMETALLALAQPPLIVRTAAFFSAEDAHNFADAVYRTLAAGHVFTAADDVTVCPTYVLDLVRTCLDLLIDGETGVWHLTNNEPLTWADFARRIARACDLPEALVAGVPAETLGWLAPRPDRVVLQTTRGSPLRPLQEAIDEFAGLMRQRHHSGRRTRRLIRTLRQRSRADRRRHAQSDVAITLSSLLRSMRTLYGSAPAKAGRAAVTSATTCVPLRIGSRCIASTSFAAKLPRPGIAAKAPNSARSAIGASFSTPRPSA